MLIYSKYFTGVNPFQPHKVSCIIIPILLTSSHSLLPFYYIREVNLFKADIPIFTGFSSLLVVRNLALNYCDLGPH